MKTKPVLMIILLLNLMLSVSCDFPFSDSGKKNGQDRTFTVVTWNVQNIFNAVDDGNEYEEYRTESGWNERNYKARLDNLATVFSYFEADTVVLNEIENSSVVQDIITKLNDYPYCCTAAEPHGAINTAVISKYPIVSSSVHSVTGTRPILQADIETPNGPVRIFAVHGKSKRDSEASSRQKRLSMGQTLAMVSEHNDECMVILAGDFNEDIDENNIFCDIRFGISDAPIKISSSYGSSFWYEPFADPEMDFKCDGTYYYNSTWSHYDHIICSFSPNWSINDAEIIYRGILLTSDGKPNSFSRTLLTGVSDHLPVLLRFDY